MNTPTRINQGEAATCDSRAQRAAERPPRAVAWLVCAAALIALPLRAAPGIITASLIATNSLAVGSTFSATFAIFGYTDAVENDGFNVKVTCNPAGLLVIGGALNDASGANASWLRSNPQDSVAGTPILTDFTTNISGEVRISTADLRLSSTRGTLAATGFLCRVDFQVVGVQGGSIVPSPAAGGTVLFASDLAPAGVPLFSGASLPPLTYVLAQESPPCTGCR